MFIAHDINHGEALKEREVGSNSILLKISLLRSPIFLACAGGLKQPCKAKITLICAHVYAPKQRSDLLQRQP